MKFTFIHLTLFVTILSSCEIAGSTSSISSLEVSGSSESSFAPTSQPSTPTSQPSTLPSVVSSIVSSNSSISSSSPMVSSSSSQLPSSSVTPSSSQLSSQFTIASNAPSYYQNIDNSLTGVALKNSLDLLISTNVSVGYDWSRFESADESFTEKNKVLTIYPRRNYLKTAHVSGNQGGTWNREHTYPQSKISGAAVNDNHHIFADDWKTNGARSNYKFGIVTKTDSTRVRDSSNLVTDNYVAGGFFEPNDAAKGEVARATLYMNTYYGYTLDGNFQTAEMAILWALNYPATDRDMQRNNRVYTNQGNRNPYVDSAALICRVYGMTSLATQQVCGLA